MKKSIYIFSAFLLLALFSVSCERVFMSPNPDTDNRAIYDEFWKIVDEKYAMWDNPDKNLDKEAIHKYTSSLVTESLSEDSLFGIFNYIIQQFKDGHSWIEVLGNKNKLAWYDIMADGINNLDQDIVQNVYLKNDYDSIAKKLKYKLLENGQIGFIQIRSWVDYYTDADIDKVLNHFADTKGIIFDVRGNGGGDPYMSTLIARHFTNEKILLGEEHFKVGPGPDDFSISKLYLAPANGVIYTKPLMVLVDVGCFSATTTFVYSLNFLPQVKFIGTRTGGGSGSTADGFLANGWHWQISVSEFIDREGRHLDNGFDPDIVQLLDSLDRTKDEVIERAIQEILNQ